MPDSLTKPAFGGSDSTQSNNSSGISAGQNANLGFGINGNYGVNQSANQSSGGSQQSGGSQNSSQNASQNTSQSNQNVYGAQDPYLQDVYAQAQNAFSQGMGDVNAMSPMVQGSMGNALGQAQGAYGNQMGGGYAQGLAGQVGPNAYTDALKGQIANDAQKLKQQNLGSLDARAAAAGMSGSSGYRDQANEMANNVDENALSQMSQLGFNAHNQGVQNQMNLAGMMDQNQQAGMGNLANIQQGAMNMFNPSMLGQQMAANYAQTIGGPTTLTDSYAQGSSMGSSQGNSFNQGSSFNQSNGFSNGFNAGMGVNGSMGFGNNYGANTGSGYGNTDTHTGIVPGLAAAKAGGF